jgi:hypothetical protein
MEPNRFPPRSRPYAWGAGLALAVVIVAAWQLTPGQPEERGQAEPAAPGQQRAVQGPAHKPTPGPPFVLGMPWDHDHDGTVIRWIHDSLHFDNSTYAADRQFLINKTDHTPTLGPYAELAPEFGATGVSEGWEWADSGRVLARIVVRGGRYAPLNIVAETSYVCVRRARGMAPPNTALLIGVHGGSITVSTLRLTRDTSIMELRGHRGLLPAVARFKTDPTDDSACFPCDHVWCCAEG